VRHVTVPVASQTNRLWSEDLSTIDEVESMSDSRLQEEVYDLVYGKHKPELAVLRLNRILEGQPENVQALSLKAYALNKLANAIKDWKYSRSALASAEKALRLNPLNDIALTSKGWALIDLGKAGESIPYLIHATTANPTNEYAWFNLAWAQYLTGNFAESSASIAKALELSPHNPIIRRGEQLMKSGNIPTHLRRKSSSE
jgi:tetratricopeptide (TPR) repeat protein